MFIDYARLMAEDGQPMSMAGWLGQTDRLLEFSRCDVLPQNKKGLLRMQSIPFGQRTVNCGIRERVFRNFRR